MTERESKFHDIIGARSHTFDLHTCAYIRPALSPTSHCVAWLLISSRAVYNMSKGCSPASIKPSLGGFPSD